MADLAAMVSRLEAAPDGDRDLDADIHIAVGLAEHGAEHWGPYLRRNAFWPPYTKNMDAAVSLLEIALPGWYWRCGSTPLFPKGWAHVSRLHADHCDRNDEAASADGKAATPAIALCIAILKAKLANTPQPNVAPDAAARLERILRLGRSMKWTPHGAPALDDENTAVALGELFQIFFQEA